MKFGDFWNLGANFYNYFMTKNGHFMWKWVTKYLYLFMRNSFWFENFCVASVDETRHFSCWTLFQIRYAFFTKIWKVRNPYKFWTDWFVFFVLAITCYWDVRFLCSWYRWKQDSKTYNSSNYDRFQFCTYQYQFWFLWDNPKQRSL